MEKLPYYVPIRTNYAPGNKKKGGKEQYFQFRKDVAHHSRNII